jgi:hypothetical protein
LCRLSADAYKRMVVVAGSVSKVEMATPMALIYKMLFPSISTFETPPRGLPSTLGLLGLPGNEVIFPRLSIRRRYPPFALHRLKDLAHPGR